MSVRGNLELAAYYLMEAKDRAKQFNYPADFIYRMNVVRKATNRLKGQLDEIHQAIAKGKKKSKKG